MKDYLKAVRFPALIALAWLLMGLVLAALAYGDDTAPLILPIPATNAIEQPTRAVPQPQCVRINVQDRGNSMSHGTATYLGAGLVVTVQHNVRDTRSKQVQIVFPQDATYMGTIIHEDTKQDMCFIVLPEMPDCPPIAMRMELPKVGEPLAVQGYAKGDYAQTWGKMSNKKYGATGVTWHAIHGTTTRQGDSGGPVFDAQGAFVGTLWGSRNDYGGEVQFTSAKWIADKILELSRELFPKPEPEVSPPPTNLLYKPGQKFAGRYHNRTRTKKFFRRVA